MALQDEAGDAVVEMHGIATDMMLVVVFLHIIGVLVSGIMHRENLVQSMITGFKTSESGTGIECTYNWLGVMKLVIVVAFGFAFCAARFGG